LGEAASFCADPKERETLYKRSNEKFEDSLKLSVANSEDPLDQLAVLCSWADCLNDRASRSSADQPEEALKVLEQALLKWHDALQVASTVDDADQRDQGRAEVRDGIGYCLMLQAPLVKDQAEREKLVQDSKNSLMEAQKLSEGISAYNLLCWNAKYGTDLECGKMLKMCIDLERLPSPWFVRSDKDLDAIREKPWFKKLFDAVK